MSLHLADVKLNVNERSLLYKLIDGGLIRQDQSVTKLQGFQFCLRDCVCPLRVED